MNIITNDSILRAAEKKIAEGLLRQITKRGYVLTIWDGEESIPCSTSKEALKIIFDVDECRVIFGRTRRGSGVGWVFVVFGNGPEDLISDYSDNAETKAIVDAAIEGYLP